MTGTAGRRLIIHCGVQKTGSTAFHHFVSRNHAALSDHLDIRTPKAGSLTRNLGRLCALFSLKDRHRDDLLAVIRQLRDELMQGEKPCLLSHENIPGAMMGRGGVVSLYPQIGPILSLLDAQFAPLVPEYVFYTRQMDAWKPSVHNQAVKSDKYPRTRDAFLDETRDCGTWDDLQARICRTIDPARVHFLALEDEPDPSRPGRQLLQLAGVPDAVLDRLDPVQGRRNESLNSGALEFMRQLNTLDLPRDARRMVAQLIRNSQTLFVSDKGAL